MSEMTKTAETTKPKLKPLAFSQNINLGCDPEFFFAKDGKVIGSEKVLPKDQQAGDPDKKKKQNDPYNQYDSKGNYINDNSKKFVIDGVQAELNPVPSTCRAGVGNEIHRCFVDLHKKFLKDGISADFSQCVEVSEEEMASLSEKSKQFGCAPSKNAYNQGENKTSVISVDPKTYRGRSAGGHIHMGISSYGTANYLANPQNREMFHAAYEVDPQPNQGWFHQVQANKGLKRSEVLIPVLDIVVGNTCVLIDRAESNKERRKVYGKAGEHRVKSYGIEYRTLSNFWLRSYQLMSFVMSACRLACHLVEQSTPSNDYVKALFDAVKREDIIKAINENDFDLAMKNFKAIEDILVTACAGNFGNYPFAKGHMKHFYYFVSKGVDHWFDKNVMEHWIKMPEAHGHGWERWLEIVVAGEYKTLKIDLNDPNIAETALEEKPETDKQNYVTGYGSLYKPLLPDKNKSKYLLELEKQKNDPATAVASEKKDSAMVVGVANAPAMEVGVGAKELLAKKVNKKRGVIRRGLAKLKRKIKA